MVELEDVQFFKLAKRVQRSNERPSILLVQIEAAETQTFHVEENCLAKGVEELGEAMRRADGVLGERTAGLQFISVDEATRTPIAVVSRIRIAQAFHSIEVDPVVPTS